MNREYAAYYGDSGALEELSPRMISMAYVLVLDAIRRSDPRSSLLDAYSTFRRVPRVNLDPTVDWREMLRGLSRLSGRSRPQMLRAYAHVLDVLTVQRPATGPLSATTGTPGDREATRELGAMRGFLERGDRTPEFLRAYARRLTDRFGAWVWYTPQGLLVGSAILAATLAGLPASVALAGGTVTGLGVYSGVVTTASALWGGLVTLGRLRIQNPFYFE
jgi:hypothetical protein